MTVLRTDLKIKKPELLGNFSFSGGYRTSEDVINGKLNDVFSPISDIDYARSAFDLVKLYPSVDTNDDSRLQDGYIFLSDQPTDPLVSTLIVELQSLTDAHQLSNIQALIIQPSTKFHGSSAVTAEVTSDIVNVENSTASIVPKTYKSVASFGENGYFFEPSTNAGFLREVTFTGPAGSATSFFTIPVTDLYEEEPYWLIRYFSFGGNGWIARGNSPTIKAEYGIEYINNSFKAELVHPLAASSIFSVKYRSSKDYRKHSYVTDSVLTLAATESIIPGTYKVKKAGTNEVYTDNKFGLFVDAGGLLFAQINYDTGVITPPENVEFTSTVEQDLGCTIFGTNAENQVYPKVCDFNIVSDSALDLSTLYLKITLADDTVFSVSADGGGIVAHANINGYINAIGYVRLTAAASVDIKRIDYDIEKKTESVTQTNWFGFDVSKLPNNGNADIFHVNEVVAIQYKERTTQTSLANNQVLNVLVDADFVDIVDNDGLTLYSPTDSNYAYDKITGELTIKSGISAFTPPYVVTALHSERRLVVDKNGNELTLVYPLRRTYPIGSIVSSCLVFGDLQALSTDRRTVSAWKNDFDDRPRETNTTSNGSANFNTVQFPIELVNSGATNQRWAIVFTSTTSFRVIGDKVGTVYSGDTSTDLVVINPLTLTPFWTLRKGAFGAGLNPGEAFIFQTIAASKPTVLSRAVSPGHSDTVNDSTTLSFFGNQGE